MLSIDISEAISIVLSVKGYLTNTVLLTSVCRQACCHFEHPSRVPKVPLSRLPKKAPATVTVDNQVRTYNRLA